MTAIGGRHERHMMRQRGAGARSIPTNFGFVFQAGPIQVTDTTTTESPLPANTSPIAIAHAEPHHIPTPSSPIYAPAPKRKRLVREEEDNQAWFQKRKRKSTKQEHTEHTLDPAIIEIAVDESHQEPSIEKKPTKRKVRKRVLVPRPRKKALVEPQSEPLQEESTPLPEPEVEALPPTKKKAKTKAPAVVKRKPKQPDTLDPSPTAEPQPEPPRDEPTPLPEPAAEASPLPKKRTKTKAPATVKRKPTRSETIDAPVHEQEHEPSNPSVHTTTDAIPSTKTNPTRHARNEKEANKHAEKTLEQESYHHIVTTPVEEQPPKKKKVVRRVRVPRTSAKPATPATVNASENATDTNVPKPSAPVEDVHKDLFEAVAPAPATKKAPKAPKRIFFNDDSDVDLDQMLSGIAAMAGTKTATKTATSKSRTTRNKVAS